MNTGTTAAPFPPEPAIVDQPASGYLPDKRLTPRHWGLSRPRTPPQRSRTRGRRTLLRRITDYANRANPYPLYAELRQHGVARQDDGSFPVGTYQEIAALLHEPRISSDHRNRTGAGDIPQARGYIDLDAPEHERLNGIGRRPVQVTI